MPQGKDTEPIGAPHGLAPPRDPQLRPQVWLCRRELLFSFLLLGLVESDSSLAWSVVLTAQRKETSLPVSDATQLGLGASRPATPRPRSARRGRASSGRMLKPAPLGRAGAATAAA